MNGYSVEILTNGSVTSGTITGSEFQWLGGRGVFACKGTFGGCTLKLQHCATFSDGNDTWYDVGTDTSLTSNGAAGFELPPCKIRVITTTTASPSGMYAKVTKNELG